MSETIWPLKWMAYQYDHGHCAGPAVPLAHCRRISTRMGNIEYVALTSPDAQDHVKLHREGNDVLDLDVGLKHVRKWNRSSHRQSMQHTGADLHTYQT
jgi:hypothetical protein